MQLVKSNFDDAKKSENAIPILFRLGQIKTFGIGHVLKYDTSIEPISKYQRNQLQLLSDKIKWTEVIDYDILYLSMSRESVNNQTGWSSYIVIGQDFKSKFYWAYWKHPYNSPLVGKTYLYLYGTSPVLVKDVLEIGYTTPTLDIKDRRPPCIGRNISNIPLGADKKRDMIYLNLMGYSTELINRVLID